MKVIVFDEKTHSNDSQRMLACLAAQGQLRKQKIKFDIKTKRSKPGFSVVSSYEIYLYSDDDYIIYQLIK